MENGCPGVGFSAVECCNDGNSMGEKGNSNSRSPSGMTTRKAKARAKTKATATN
jgi:hypothetical protein